jgi:hypothetical protein
MHTHTNTHTHALSLSLSHPHTFVHMKYYTYKYIYIYTCISNVIYCGRVSVCVHWQTDQCVPVCVCEYVYMYIRHAYSAYFRIFRILPHIPYTSAYSVYFRIFRILRSVYVRHAQEHEGAHAALRFECVCVCECVCRHTHTHTNTNTHTHTCIWPPPLTRAAAPSTSPNLSTCTLFYIL